MKIVVLGSFVQACCWQVDVLPKAGETTIASNLSIELGGKGLNVAVCTHRLGAEVTLLLGIGSDTAGDQLIHFLNQEGLSCDYVWQLNAPSGHGAGLIGANGQNIIAIYSGANALLTAKQIEQASTVITSSDLVYGQLETSLEAIEAAFQIAKSKGVRTVLNPSPWQHLPKSLFNNTDVIIVNEIEVQTLLALPLALTGSLSDCIAVLNPVLDNFWHQWQASLLVITLGEKGSLAFNRQGTLCIMPAYPITAIDTVGAGDAFASGLCIELCKQSPLSDALRYANACGAYLAAKQGVLNALPTEQILENFRDSLR